MRWRVATIQMEGGHNTDGGWPHEMEDGHMRWMVVT